MEAVCENCLYYDDGVCDRWVWDLVMVNRDGTCDHWTDWEEWSERD